MGIKWQVERELKDIAGQHRKRPPFARRHVGVTKWFEGMSRTARRSAACLRSSDSLPNTALRMVNATRGLLVQCDVPMKQYLLWIEREERFIINDLDENHLFAKQDAEERIQASVQALYEEIYYEPLEEGMAVNASRRSGKRRRIR